MKILLTGATGFIGNHVYKKLIQANYQVSVISRKQTAIKNWFQTDILNFEETTKVVEKVQADILIHLAWDVTHGKFWNAENNEHYAEASKNLFDMFLENGGKKIIATGTCAEYPTSDKPVSEDVKYEGELTPYGYAKKSVFNYLISKQKKEDFEFTWLRIFGIYGEGEDDRRFFPSAIRAIKNNELFEIKTPNCFSDYVHVKDVAKCIVDCVTKEVSGAINVGTGKSIALLDLYKILENYVRNGFLEFIQTYVRPDQNSRIPDCSNLHTYGFKFDLLNGIKKQNYRENI